MGLSNAPGVAGWSIPAVPCLGSVPSATRVPTADSTMTKRFLPCFLLLVFVGQAVRGAAQDPPKSTEKAAAVIPPPRAEPVVPASPAKSIAQQLNDAFVAVFERVAPTVVVIDVTKKPSSEDDGTDYFPDFFFRQGPDGNGQDSTGSHLPPRPQSEGSGFIIQAGGYILTNNHVVAGADKITVRLKDGRTFPAKLTGLDDKTDIAVVKIDATDLPTAELADSDAVRVGEIACAIGVQYKLAYSFTTGVVSAKGRDNLELGTSDNLEDFIQTDASINPGNSGGPLVNLDGKVIGMNTLINGLNRGLGFAIPSNMLREVGDQIINKGHVVRPYIGAFIESVNEETADKYGTLFNGVKKGVIVTRVLPDSPAFRSELRVTDVITEVDGVPVASDRDLQKQVLSKRVGTTVQLTVYRKGKTIKVPITTNELPTAIAGTSGNGSLDGGPNPDADTPKPETNTLYGLQIQTLTKDIAAKLGLTASSGVVVTAVVEDSPAARVKIAPNDVITAVDDEPIKDAGSFKDALKKGDPGRGILCYVERPSGKTFVVIKAK